jgi:UDP-glucose/GDP-mannose dehydrogenase family, NAD binding domain
MLVFEENKPNCDDDYRNQTAPVLASSVVVPAEEVPALRSGMSRTLQIQPANVIEPELGDLILHGVDTGRLQATQRVQRLGDISLICVGTPSNVLSRLGNLARG